MLPIIVFPPWLVPQYVYDDQPEYTTALIIMPHTTVLIPFPLHHL